jgi:hypothetical protein
MRIAHENLQVRYGQYGLHKFRPLCGVVCSGLFYGKSFVWIFEDEGNLRRPLKVKWLLTELARIAEWTESNRAWLEQAKKGNPDSVVCIRKCVRCLIGYQQPGNWPTDSAKIIDAKHDNAELG